MTSPQSAENSNVETENKEMLMLQLKTPTRRITLKSFMNSLIKQKQKILLQTKHQC